MAFAYSLGSIDAAPRWSAHAKVGFDAAEIEGLAVAFYERLSLDPKRPVDTFRLARKLLGAGGLVRGTSIVGLPAKLFMVNGERRIAVNRRLSVPYAQFFVGHELGHIVCDDMGYREDDLERVCDQFGAAVMAPIPAVCAMLRTFGPDHEAIADEVGSTQTWAALRVAECMKIPRAIIAPKKLYLRGPDDFVWPAEAELRRMARVPRPGVKRASLTDEPDRVVLDVDEDMQKASGDADL